MPSVRSLPSDLLADWRCATAAVWDALRRADQATQQAFLRGMRMPCGPVRDDPLGPPFGELMGPQPGDGELLAKFWAGLPPGTVERLKAAAERVWAAGLEPRPASVAGSEVNSGPAK
jgi:hypothetical protein